MVANEPRGFNPVFPQENSTLIAVGPRSAQTCDEIVKLAGVAGVGGVHVLAL